MRIRMLGLSLVCAASLCGQYNRGHRFSWQEACFKNPGAPFCPGHDYAVKNPPPSKDAGPRTVTNPSFSPQEDPTASVTDVTPSVIVAGGIDWRFADPLADALAGFDFSALSASPLARKLIAQLGAKEGLTEADVQKMFDGLSGVDHVVLSVRDTRIVVMVTGRVANAGWKGVPLSANAMLIGDAEAVDQAVQRIALKGPPSELTRLAGELQTHSDFWAVGSAGLAGPEAVSVGVKRFSLSVSIRNRLTSDAAFELNEVPGANTLQMWPATLGAATLDGGVVHVRMSMEPDQVEQKFGPIAASLLGQRLATLVKVARQLPVPKQTKPVIYGLDDGPKVVNQDPNL